MGNIGALGSIGPLQLTAAPKQLGSIGSLGALLLSAAAGPKHQLSLLVLGLEQFSLTGVPLPLAWENGSAWLRRLRPSFRVMQLSHKSKLHGKQVNLKKQAQVLIPNW